MNALLYPASPVVTDGKKLAPSAAFKQQVSKVIVSIVLFFMVYLILIIAATGLAIACFYIGLSVIIAMPKFITIMLGLGLMGVGVSVVFFLIKFIFAVSKNENARRIEIKEADQPQLFAFIKKLTKETQTTFPKKIYLSPDVNACVFYNSSFWSMFLPVRKNLEIGLGLVNTVNMSEFKAIMAHEFGHFSQRSMKLGSFTYNVNRVIYNMLYENTSYTRFLQSWSRISGYFVLFAGITVKISQGIQWVLKGMYSFINKNYMSLSREMEFHADAVAASVAGGNNLVSGLSRVEVSQSCYNSALEKANEWMKQNKVVKNIFGNQLSVFHSLAKQYQLPLNEGLPEVSFQFIQSFSKSRINYKNQWASHPPIEERKQHLDGLNINCTPDERRAWKVFEDIEALQERMTNNLYHAVHLETTPEICDARHFEEWCRQENEKYELPSAYNGFYDNRYINMDSWDIDFIGNTGKLATFEEIFSEKNGQLHVSLKNNENDLLIANAIKDKEIDVSSFDFDGKKYTREDAGSVISILEEEIEQQKRALESLDKDAFVFLCNKAGINAGSVKNEYAGYKAITAKHNAYLDIADKALNAIAPLYQSGLTEDQITHIIKELKEVWEPALKKRFSETMNNRLIFPQQNEELYGVLNNFLNKEYAYFVFGAFQNDELGELNELVLKVADEWNAYKYRNYKKLLEMQLQYYNPGK